MVLHPKQRKKSESENAKLRTYETDLNRVRLVLSDDVVDEAIKTAKDDERLQKVEKQNKRKLNRDPR